ncbi:MAG: Na/Pi symporter [Thermoanaerobaculia bacterium]|nr:Na/Pi symporter [Thermoanaerobaculia bacterium]
MATTIPRPPDRPPSTTALRIGRIVAVLLLLFIFLMGVKGLGDGFKMLGRDVVEHFFRATSNPFVGLIIGILATTLVQSSSVTTSMIVGLVAAPENPLPIANAVPMIMGANIGTTVTNTLVSLGHIGRKQEFQRAFAAATCHDFFNYFGVLILLPLELMTGFMRRAAESMTELLLGFGTSGVEYESPIKESLSVAWKPLKYLITSATTSTGVQALLIVVVSAALIFSALYLLVRTMRSMLQSRVEMGLMGALGEKALIGMTVGMIATVMVQSSSITTSLLIPLAGAGIITIRQVFPVTIGANVGTTLTALLASLAATGEHAAAGITIALVHLIFNLCATIVIYPVERIRNLPLMAAEKLATIAVRSKLVAIGYILLLFYGLPALIAAIDWMLI